MAKPKDQIQGREIGFRHACATLGTCLKTTLSILDEAEIDGYDVEARLLCEWATGHTKLDFMTRPDELVTSEQAKILESALQKRLAGMPVHRIMGFREFYGLRLELSSETLEPRPDTETLVDQVIEIMRQNNRTASSLRILDLGTGTGAVALALLSKLPNAVATATDISRQAIETTSKNAANHGLTSRLNVLQSDWFENVVGKFDIVVSNPPYIRTEIIEELAVEVRDHDPLIALDGGPDGLRPYRVIASNVASHLAVGAIVCVEIGYDQAVDIIAIFEDEGFHLLALCKDIGGRDRSLAFALIQAELSTS